MTIEEIEKEITAREKMLHNAEIIFHQIEGQVVLLYDLLKKEKTKIDSNAIK